MSQLSFALNISLLELDSPVELEKKRICRIVTTDFPQYFAVVSRIKQDSNHMGPDGGMLSSSTVPMVQASFPQGALTKKIRVGLQVPPGSSNQNNFQWLLDLMWMQTDYLIIAELFLAQC